MGDYKAAIEYHKRYLKIAREVGDKGVEGNACCFLGNAYRNMGDYKTSIDYHEQDLKIAKEQGEKHRQGRAYCNLGIAYHRLGDIKTAIDYYERHLEIAEEVGDKEGKGKAYGNLGSAYRNLGDFKTATEYHERNLKITKEVQDKVGEGMAYSNLGNAYRCLGDIKTAIDYHERGLKIARETGDKAEEGTAFGSLGSDYQSLGDFKTAIAYHKLHLKIAKEVGDKLGEGTSCGHLGNAYHSLGDIKTAIDYHERDLKIAKEVGDRLGEGTTCGNLAAAYCSLGDFKTAIDYNERHIRIAKEVEDRAGEGNAYCTLGNVYYNLGDFKTAIDCRERHLAIAKEVGDKIGEGKAYCNLGNVYHSLGDFKTAVNYHDRHLQISKEVGDKAGEGTAYNNLAIVYRSLGDFKTAIKHFERNLKIAKEVGDKVGEGTTYGNLGNAYRSLGNIKTAIDYHELGLKIAKEVGAKPEVARLLYCLGISFESQGSPLRALDCFRSSVRMFNDIRRHLPFKDEWKISYRDLHKGAYTCLWRLLLKQGKEVEALFAAEQGRAQALNDLMEFNYGLDTASFFSHTPDESPYDSFSFLPSNTAFIAIDKREIVFWVFQNGKVKLRRKEFGDDSSLALNAFFQSLVVSASDEIGVRDDVKCEDRSLVNLGDEKVANERALPTLSYPVPLHASALKTFYDVIIDSITDLVQGNELVLVPEGALCLAPYAVFVGPDSRFLCESFRIRVIPSLTSLKLIVECPDAYHSKTGVLLVGDPWVQEVVYQGTKLKQLPCAREEVEMIGRILNTVPLVGREATKEDVLKRISSVALVHIAAHGRMDTGEIALTPNTTRTSQIPKKEDFLLTMRDVISVKIGARLVVLSCCHSARGEVKAEGVVGIARAFLGAGARSVLVSLWAIDDEATLEFMNCFYLHLMKGKSASESLNLAMKCMRESERFHEVKYWAPFVLIGDDVTLNFDGGD